MTHFQIKRLVFSIYLIILIYKYFNYTLLHQQTFPPLLYPSLNLFYWLFLIFDLQNIFNYGWLKYLLDLTLLTSCLLSIVNLKSNIYPLIFTLTIWLYQFLYYSILAYQPFLIGILLPCIPFIFKNEDRVFITFNFGRYLLCGLYFFAGIFKIINKGIFNINQLSDSIKISTADFIFYNPHHIKTAIIKFFIENIYLSYSLFICAVLLELAFFIGFVTKKYDLFLAFLFLLFHFVNFLLLDLTFTNHAIIVLFFLPFKNKLITS
jgi:hypothetical protein